MCVTRGARRFRCGGRAAAVRPRLPRRPKRRLRGGATRGGRGAHRATHRPRPPPPGCAARSCSSATRPWCSSWAGAAAATWTSPLRSQRRASLWRRRLGCLCSRVRPGGRERAAAPGRGGGGRGRGREQRGGRRGAARSCWALGVLWRGPPAHVRVPLHRRYTDHAGVLDLRVASEFIACGEPQPRVVPPCARAAATPQPQACQGPAFACGMLHGAGTSHATSMPRAPHTAPLHPLLPRSRSCRCARRPRGGDM